MTKYSEMIIKYLFFILLLCFSQFAFSQNSGYSQKKEYGLNGNVKSVTTYMVDVSKYRIPTDTLNYSGKTYMTFNKNGDVILYNRSYNLPDYNYVSKSIFKGSGKNISYEEDYWLKDFPKEHLKYQFVWTSDLEYKITSVNDKTNTVRFISLNKDFTVDKVIFKRDSYTSEEKMTYTYNENVLEKVVLNLTVTENEETKTSEDIRIVKSVDIYNNPTVFHFFKSVNSRVPTTVLFKYYEYY